MTEEEYITLHSSREPENLKELYRQTYLTRLYPRMCCYPHQGRLLKMLTEMIRPATILELGAFSGYSTLCFAEGMPSGCQLHTIEIDDEAEDALRQAFAASERNNDIHLHIGDALDIIPTLAIEWDLVYIDANKRHYLDYYQLIKPSVAPGGYILADNTLWSDAVLHQETTHDAQSIGIMKFNDFVSQDPDVEVVMLPLYDGMTLIRKKQ